MLDDVYYQREDSGTLNLNRKKAVQKHFAVIFKRFPIKTDLFCQTQ